MNYENYENYENAGDYGKYAKFELLPEQRISKQHQREADMRNIKFLKDQYVREHSLMKLQSPYFDMSSYYRDNQGCLFEHENTLGRWTKIPQNTSKYRVLMNYN